MGMTLSAADLKQVLRRPRDVFAAAAAQYLIIPLLAYAIARGLHYPAGTSPVPAKPPPMPSPLTTERCYKSGSCRFPLSGKILRYIMSGRSS
jgi:hypothetical protein